MVFVLVSVVDGSNQCVFHFSVSIAQGDIECADETTKRKDTCEQKYCIPVVDDITTATPGYSGGKPLESPIKLFKDINKKPNPQSTQSSNSLLDPASESKSVPNTGLKSLQSPNTSVYDPDECVTVSNSLSNLSGNPAVSADAPNISTVAPNSESTLLQMADLPLEKETAIEELPKTIIVEDPLKSEEAGASMFFWKFHEAICNTRDRDVLFRTFPKPN